MPPHIALPESRLTPPSDDLVPVRIIEALQHHLQRRIPPGAPGFEGALEGTDAPAQPVALRLEELDVITQSDLLVPLPIQNLGDDRQTQPQIAQQQDALQPGHCRHVVVPVAVATGPGRAQQPDAVVVPQRAAGDTGLGRELMDAPLHVTLLTGTSRRPTTSRR